MDDKRKREVEREGKKGGGEGREERRRAGGRRVSETPKGSGEEGERGGGK